MEEMIKKGPWKEEEDQVLIEHVRKYGPGHWSSLRSKGLLRRTGKSCRLRWVNKLRPHLKTGEKFTAEEERRVIELQGQFGNKWARIATYLTGRTDNDVKNFWSSRQKRLTRILHTCSSSSSSTTTNQQLEYSPVFHQIPPFSAPNFASPPEQEPTANNSLVYQHNTFQLEYTPQIPSYLNEFEPSNGPSPGPTEQPPIMPAFFGQGHNCQIAPMQEPNGEVDIDFMIDDDFPPIDMFDSFSTPDLL
ncbi:hypothetical protein ACP275_14G156600 [Erythranthe tilingii]